MPKIPACPQCGAEVRTAALGGLCPGCVAGIGFGDAQTDHDTAKLMDVEGADGGAGKSPGIPKRIRYLGDYEVLSEIAQGGMGVVYRARQMTLNRDVAVKMILAGQLASKIDVKRFRVEAEAAARLDHPNIVAIHEIGVHEGCHYFTMSLIEGGSLAEQLPKFANDPNAAAALIAKVARAIHYAHQRGVLHRDIKPGNILLDENGEPHVTDFGLAKLVERETSLTMTGSVVGSPAYMAPEQAHGGRKPVTSATDVYGLGAVLYHLLTGSVPFTGESPIDVLVKVVEMEPQPLSKLNAGIDKDLETICLKCLEKRPVERYTSAEELAEDLERWLRDEPVVARASTSARRFHKWVLRHRAVAILSATLMVLLMTAGGVILWQRDRILHPEDPREREIRKSPAAKNSRPPNRLEAAAVTRQPDESPVHPVSYTPWSEATKLGPTINGALAEMSPCLAPDGLSFYFASNRARFDRNSRNTGGMGLWYSRWNPVGETWLEPDFLDRPLCSPYNENGPTLSRDGMTMIFSSDRPGGMRGWDLYVGRYEPANAQWGPAANLGSTVNSDSDEEDPCLSADGLTLIFSRGSQAASKDLWLAERNTGEDEWSEPIRMNSPINTADAEGAPWLSADGLTILFSSARPGGLGGDDLWEAHRPSRTSAWFQPVNLGQSVNSGSTDTDPCLSSDGRMLLFHSPRKAGAKDRNLDIWISTREVLLTKK